MLKYLKYTLNIWITVKTFNKRRKVGNMNYIIGWKIDEWMDDGCDGWMDVEDGWMWRMNGCGGWMDVEDGWVSEGRVGKMDPRHVMVKKVTFQKILMVNK